ncbi:MAG: hypothetical protein AAF645_10480 [Myxococcota bacterium]
MRFVVHATRQKQGSALTLALLVGVACGDGQEVAARASAPNETAAPTPPSQPSEAPETAPSAPEARSPVGTEQDDNSAPEEGEPEESADEDTFQCVVPPIPIPRPRACERGRGYPRCKWQMPHATLSGGRYRRWRNTIMEHWWGRPELVAFVLASMDAFEQRYPDQVVAVGDLDAPGPRHTTHDRGVDVDLYLLGALMTENAGAGSYPGNYEGKSEEEVEELRQRVETMARILAQCSDGKIRIYYNDDVVLERFHAWYDAQGFEPNPFGRPMQRHNRLHEFHFHVSIDDSQRMLPMTELPEGVSHPRARIEPPPPPDSAPHLSSMNRRPGE